jgi:ribosomal protein L32
MTDDEKYKRFDKRIADCLKKKHYKTRSEARKHQRQSIGQFKVNFYIYKCPFCKEYALTTTLKK